MKKIIFLGAVAILLALGLVLASCSEKAACPGDGKCKVDITKEDADATECADKCITKQGEALEKKYADSESEEDFEKFFEEALGLKCNC